MTSPHTGFNLVDDPWIELGDQVVSIREALLSGHELPGWPSGEPAAGPVIIRLLMPIVYRVTGMDDPDLRGPRFAAQQVRLLNVGRLEPPKVESYLDRHRDRFWLTGAPAGLPPFAQDPALEASGANPVAKLVTTWASGNNPALGPHAPVLEIDCANAARWLLITHCYSAGGYYAGRTPDVARSSCVASRLRRTVSIHPVGSTFAESLLFHLVPAPDGWQMGCPFWELPPPDDREARYRERAGLLEQLSGRHDKAILLASSNGGGITGAHISVGQRREQGLECPDPYLVMNSDREPHLQRAGRDAWRDIDALLIQSEHVEPAARLDARILTWCRDNVGTDSGRWSIVTHRSTQSRDEGWGLASLPDILGLFADGATATLTASALIAAAEDAAGFMGKKLRALSGAMGRDGRSTRYDDARGVFWSRAEQTFWDAVTVSEPDPTPDASWVGLLRQHAIEGFDAATRHLSQVPRTHLEVEHWRSEVSRWTWPKPIRGEYRTKGAATT